jgi:hypothetical protein
VQGFAEALRRQDLKEKKPCVNIKTLCDAEPSQSLSVAFDLWLMDD